MFKSILVMGAATACLAFPSAAESYIRGDGCGGTYVDRKSEMMAGNITGGTRYKCTPFQRRAAAPATSTRSYSTPRTTTQTYTSRPVTTRSYTGPSHTYAKPHTTYASRGYVAPAPRTTYQSFPHTTYSTGRTVYQGQSTTTYPSRGYVTTHPRRTYPSQPRTTYQSSPRTVYQTPPSPTYSTQSGPRTYEPYLEGSYGYPRVSGNLANMYTTVTPDAPGSTSTEFEHGRPKSYVTVNPR